MPGKPGTPAIVAPVKNQEARLSNFENWVVEGEFEHMSSSCVESAAYDDDSLALKVKFIGGGGKAYSPISKEKAADFYHAGSKMGWIWNFCLVRGKGNKGRTQVNVSDL